MPVVWTRCSYVCYFRCYCWRTYVYCSLRYVSLIDALHCVYPMFVTVGHCWPVTLFVEHVWTHVTRYVDYSFCCCYYPDWFVTQNGPLFCLTLGLFIIVRWPLPCCDVVDLPRWRVCCWAWHLLLTLLLIVDLIHYLDRYLFPPPRPDVIIVLFVPTLPPVTCSVLLRYVLFNCCWLRLLGVVPVIYNV